MISSRAELLRKIQLITINKVLCKNNITQRNAYKVRFRRKTGTITNEKGRLSKDEIESMINDAEKYRFTERCTDLPKEQTA